MRTDILKGIGGSMYYEILKRAGGIAYRIMETPRLQHTNIMYRGRFHLVENVVRIHWSDVMPSFVSFTDYREELDDALQKLPNVEFDKQSLWFTFK